MPRRFVAAFAAIAGVILLFDSAFLVSGVHRGRRERIDLLATLEPGLTGRSRAIKELQTKSDEERASIFAAIRLMSEIYDLAREADGIDEAHTKAAGATEAMSRTKAALVLLPHTTEQILAHLERQRSDAGRLLSLTEDEAEVEYLRAVTVAYGSMSQTHEIYGRMSAKLDEGMKLYEDLLVRTSDFLAKEKSRFFRSRREAADFYTIETEKGGLAEALDKFSEELSTLELEAGGAVQRTSEAFAAVERSKKKLP